MSSHKKSNEASMSVNDGDQSGFVSLKQEYEHRMLPTGKELDELEPHIKNIGERTMKMVEDNNRTRNEVLRNDSEFEIKMLEGFNNRKDRSQWIGGGLILIALLMGFYLIANANIGGYVFVIFSMAGGVSLFLGKHRSDKQDTP